MGATDPDVAAVQAVVRALHDYAHAVDNRRWDDYEALFDPAATIDYRPSHGPSGAPPEVRRWMEAHLTWEHLPVSQHLLANIRVDVRDDAATATASYLNPDVTASAEGRALFVNGGVYDALLRRDGEGRWRFTSLRAEILWTATGQLTTLTPQPEPEPRSSAPGASTAGASGPSALLASRDVRW